MKIMKRALILLLVSVFMFTAVPVFAGGETPQEVFYSLDVNKDGRVIKEELRIIYPSKTVLEEKFIIFDKDGNGYVELDEFIEIYNK
ncbi:MAG: EF-hand domain-containing protein [Syntrophales bacterium]|nr:EF-hand domain-containing protein [Syntrophales bacterium]